MKTIQQLELEAQEWKQLALDALSGDEMLVYKALFKVKLQDILIDLESVRRVLLLCDGKPCVETISDIINRFKQLELFNE